MKFISIAMIMPIMHATMIAPKKLCKDCKFFIAHEKQCMKFGNTNLVTGEQNFDSASSTRDNNDKCGKDAKYFEENTIKYLTIPYYFTLTYWYIFPAIFSYGAWIYVILNK